VLKREGLRSYLLALFLTILTDFSVKPSQRMLARSLGVEKRGCRTWVSGLVVVKAPGSKHSNLSGGFRSVGVSVGLQD
jgi:hypothetical protein